MADRHQSAPLNVTGPASSAVAVVNGTALTDLTRGLYVGVAGDLEVIMATGETVMFKAAAVGYHPLRVTKVTTNTLATNILALY